MRLVELNVKQFRSIQEASLIDCDAFNVLIGKNNSGKSNILSALDAFFGCLAKGNIVILRPGIGALIDFHERVSEAPIKLEALIELSLAERDALVRNIVTEFPQVKNAVDGLNPLLRLAISLTVPEVGGIAYVDSVSLVGQGQQEAYQLLEVSAVAASEIAAHAKSEEEASTEANALRTLHRGDDPRRRRLASPRDAMPLDYLMREIPSSLRTAEVRRRVEEIYRDADDPEDLYRLLQRAAEAAEERAEAVRKQQKLQNHVRTFAGQANVIPKYIDALIAEVGSLSVLHLTEQRKPIGREEASRLLDLKISRGGPDVLRRIQDTVVSLLGVRIDAFSSQSSTTSGERTPELDVDDFLVQVNGSGIKEALRLVLDFELNSPDILLVEEPEVHLHPALEIAMMRYLKRVSIGSQVFLTTHSTNFLDTADMRNVYLVNRDESKTQLQKLDVEEAEEEIPKELGIRLSSLFMFDRLVFVEGASDEAILRELASVLGINLSQANVGFVPMGGVGNFTHYAAEATLSFLTKRRVDVIFVLDRDERDEEEAKRLNELVGSRGEVRILDRRELENYLLIPRAIAAFLTQKSLDANKKAQILVTEEQVALSMESASESLKRLAIERRVIRASCKPIYPSRKRLRDESENPNVVERIAGELDRLMMRLEEAKGKIEDRLREYETTVEARWATEKLKLVPGDELLDAICREFGMRYHKERDGSRLAALLNSSDIAVEIRSLIELFSSP